jgi:hypothetical protein
MTTILALDPGTTHTAWMFFGDAPSNFGWDENAFVLDIVDSHPECPVACEMLACYGMPVGKEVFETAYWIGRFMQATQKEFIRVYRGEVKTHLCRSQKAKDANIRQALIDKFGGSNAIGKKKTPGPLYGVSSHSWSALAVAVTAMETKLNTRLATA